MKRLVLLILLVILLLGCEYKPPKEPNKNDSFLNYLIEIPNLDSYELKFDPEPYLGYKKYELKLYINVDVNRIYLEFEGNNISEIKNKIIEFKKTLGESVF